MSEVPLQRLDDPSVGVVLGCYRSTSPIKNCLLLGPYSRPMPRVLGGGQFLMSEVPL